MVVAVVDVEVVVVGYIITKGEYFTKKLIFCQGLRQQLSFFAEEIFGIFKLKLPYFWTICDKNA